MGAFGLWASVVPMCIICHLGNFFFVPILGQVRAEFNVTAAEAGAAVTVYSLCNSLSCIVCGPLADAFGRRPTTIATLVVHLAGSAGCFFSSDLTGLVLSRGVMGLGVTGIFIMPSVVVADAVKPEAQGKTLGNIMMLLVMGPIVGPLAAGFLSAAYGWRSVFALHCGLVVLLLAVVTLFMPETLSDEKKKPLSPTALMEPVRFYCRRAALRGAGNHFVVSSCMSVHAVLTGCMWVCQISIPLFLKPILGLTEQEIGMIFSAMWLSTLGGSRLGGRLADWKPWLHRILCAVTFTVSFLVYMAFVSKWVGGGISVWIIIPLLMVVTNVWMIFQISTRIFMMKSFGSGQGGLTAGIRSGTELGNSVVIQAALLMFQSIGIPITALVLAGLVWLLIGFNSRMHYVIGCEEEGAGLYGKETANEVVTTGTSTADADQSGAATVSISVRV